MKKYRFLFSILILLLLCGCGAQNTADENSTSDNSASDNSISVNSDSTADSAGTDTVSGDAAQSGDSSSETNPQKIIPVQRITVPVSTSSSSTTDIPDSSSTDTAKTGNGTPATFDVGTCLIEVDGTYDTKLAGEILTALNDARTQEGLDPFDSNAGLNQVADVRAKEITYSLSHTRANGSYWSTVAPDYYEAECIAKDFGTADDTVNAWLSESSTRQYLLNDAYASIGLSCFQYAGSDYIIAALGK